MKNIFIPQLLSFLLPVCLLMSCYKNYTRYYPDTDNEGIAIFSNTGNNLLTCFIAGKAWQTNNRATSLFPGRINYEVFITKQQTASPMDTLYITWTGHYSADSNAAGTIRLILPVAKNFSYKNLSALQGQRLHVDTTNGFFYTELNGSATSAKKGIGNIYFNRAAFDSIGPSSYSGKMSGLFDADFISYKITKGRFDHDITPQQINF